MSNAALFIRLDTDIVSAPSIQSVLLEALQKRGIKPSAAFLRSVQRNIFQLCADKRKSSLNITTFDSIGGAAFMHGGPPANLEWWNDVSALQPDSTLSARLQGISGKARQHLSIQPIAIRDRHSHGLSKLTTQATVTHDAEGPDSAPDVQPIQPLTISPAGNTIRNRVGSGANHSANHTQYNHQPWRQQAGI